MRNFWLDKITEKSKVQTWNFEEELKKMMDKAAITLEMQSVKVLPEPSSTENLVRRWKRMEITSQCGHSWFFADENASCGAWAKLVERPDYGVPLPQASVKQQDDVLPPWNTETYNGIDLENTEEFTPTNGWECDL
jgi:hypothetical protein